MNNNRQKGFLKNSSKYMAIKNEPDVDGSGYLVEPVDISSVV